ncbi:MAG TPA: M56 family metallopeptidase [Thermoanaerobaculia bacterium]
MTAFVNGWQVHLAHALWQATLAGALLLVIVRLARRTSPRFRHALVTIGLVKFALPPMLPLPTGIFSAAPPVGELTAFVRDRDARSLAILLAIHVAGAVVVLIRFGLDLLRIHALRRRAVLDGAAPRNVPILLSHDVTVPMAIGIFRPAIVLPHRLPAALTPAQLQDVLAHELHHVLRRDVLRNALQTLLGAVWWFNPVFHLLAREARVLREELCDDALLAAGTCERAQYARTLLAAAEFAGAQPALAATIAEGPHSLLSRVRRIADARFAPSQRLGFAALVAIILVALLVLPGLRISHANRFAFDRATLHALHH